MTESEILNKILLTYGREPDVTLWRQNTGVAKSEVVTRQHLARMLVMLDGHPDTIHEARKLVRALLSEKPRFTRFGLCEGSSDIIGIVRRDMPLLTRDTDPSDPLFHPEHGIFLALEVKTATGRVSKEQQQFLDLVNRRGGVGRVVRSVEDAGAAIQAARLL